jgi:hypothetical protein
MSLLLAHQAGSGRDSLRVWQRRQIVGQRCQQTLKALSKFRKVARYVAPCFENHDFRQHKLEVAGQRMIQHRIGPAWPDDAAEQNIGVDRDTNAHSPAWLR